MARSRTRRFAGGLFGCRGRLGRRGVYDGSAVSVRVVTPAFWGWLLCSCFCRRFLFLGPGISFALASGWICLDRAWHLRGTLFALVCADVGQRFRLRFPGARGLELFCPVRQFFSRFRVCPCTTPSALRGTPGRSPYRAKGLAGRDAQSNSPVSRARGAAAPPRSAARKLRDKTRRVLARRFPAEPPWPKRRTRAKRGAGRNIQFAGKNMNMVVTPHFVGVTTERNSRSKRHISPTAAEPPAGDRRKTATKCLARHSGKPTPKPESARHRPQKHHTAGRRTIQSEQRETLETRRARQRPQAFKRRCFARSGMQIHGRVWTTGQPETHDQHCRYTGANTRWKADFHS